MSTARSRVTVVALAGVAVALFAGPPAYGSLSRDQANAIAMRILVPGSSPQNVLYGLPSPLSPGTTVIEDAPGSADARSEATDTVVRTGRSVPLAQRVWLFWEDQGVGRDFPHPSRLLLLDDRSGAVVESSTYYWAPLIDGRPPPFLSGTTAARYVVSSSLPRTSIGQPAPQPASVVPAGFMHDDCLIVLGEIGSPLFAGDLKDWAGWGRHVGMRVFELGNHDGQDLVREVGKLTAGANPCRNILVSIQGHGVAAPNTGWPENASNETPFIVVTEKYTARKRKGSSDDYYAISGGVVLVDDLEKMLAQNPQTTFEIDLNACFAGRFQKALKAFNEKSGSPGNLVALGSSTNDRQVTAAGFTHAGYVGRSGARPENAAAAVRAAGKGDVLLNPGQPRQPDPASESDYTNAVVGDLYKWADSQSLFGASPCLGDEIGQAFGDATALDFAAYGGLHWEDPQAYSELARFYRYDLAIDVHDATQRWHGAGAGSGDGTVDGSGKASWTGTWRNLLIVVDRGCRTVKLSSDHRTRFTLSQDTSAAGSWHGESGVAPNVVSFSCSYTVKRGDLHVDIVPMAGTTEAEFAAANEPDPIYRTGSGSYQYTGLFGVILAADEQSPSPARVSCTGGRDAGILTTGGVVVGTDDCTSVVNLASDSGAFRLFAWDLGRTEPIHVTQQFQKTATGYPCSPSAPPSAPGVSTTFSGLYSVTLTRSD